MTTKPPTPAGPWPYLHHRTIAELDELHRDKRHIIWTPDMDAALLAGETIAAAAKAVGVSVPTAAKRLTLLRDLQRLVQL